MAPVPNPQQCGAETSGKGDPWQFTFRLICKLTSFAVSGRFNNFISFTFDEQNWHFDSFYDHLPLQTGQRAFGRRFKDTLFRFIVCKWASSLALATCKISAAINPSKSLGHGHNWRLSDFKYLPSFDDQASRIRTKMATPSQALVFSNLLAFKAHQPEWPELDARRWGR